MKKFCAALIFTFTLAAAAQDDAARYQALINELRCLVCQNQSIAESNAPLAADLREQVRTQIAQGRSDAEIVEFVTARYGDFVLYRPPFKPSTWLLWLGPFAALVLAGLIAVAFVRRSQQVAGPSPQPSPLNRGEGEILPRPLEGGEVGRSPGEGPSAKVVVFGALSLVAFAAVWYFLAGSWRTQALVDLAEADPAAAQQQAFSHSLESLQRHVEKNPEDADAWMWLGRARVKQERYAEGAAALARANELSASQSPDLLVEEGEAIAHATGRSLTGGPAEKFEQALALAPDHPRALWFAGLAALHAGDELGALARWERLLAQEMPQEVRGSLEQSVAELRQRTGIKEKAPTRTAAELRLQLEITVAPELRQEIQPGDTLFVYARTPEGAGPPLAARRFSAAQLPLRIALDDSHSMMPALKLSSADRWLLVARVSRSGDAQPQAGNLEGELTISRDQVGSTHNLVIDRRRVE